MDLLDTHVYSLIGEEGFQRLVAAFYRRVAADDVLGPMYPESDLAGAERRLREFLVQRFGGPGRYSEQRGHPRLRMRHVPFAIGAAERDAWLRNMRAAVDSLDLPAPYAETLWNYLESAAFSLQNRPA